MTTVNGLVWDDWNKDHIGKHGITIEEVEEVCHGEFEARESYRKRILLCYYSIRKGGEMMSKNNQIKPKAAIFKSRAKEAEYWEKNFDKTWKKGKSEKVKFAKNLSETLNIRLDPETLNDVRIQAKKKGLGPTQLIRMWIMEKTSDTDFRKAL